MELKFLKTYRSFKKIFIKPKIKWRFWRFVDSYFLPYIDRVPTIYFGDKEDRTRLDDWSDEGKKKHPILSKIIKPAYPLPWLKFGFYDYDVDYKVKYNSVCVESYPSLSIVFFGWCLTIYAVAPEVGDHSEDDYWETLILYGWYCGDLKKVLQETGKYRRLPDKKGKWVFDTRFLKRKEDKKELNKLKKSFDNMLDATNLTEPGIYFEKDTLTLVRVVSNKNSIVNLFKINLSPKNFKLPDISPEDRDFIKLPKRPYYLCARFYDNVAKKEGDNKYEEIKTRILKLIKENYLKRDETNSESNI